MIAIDDIPAKGVALNDHLPVNIYKGNTKVAGWHPQTVSGEGTISLDGAYNVPPDALVIDGKCVQGSTTGKNLAEFRPDLNTDAKHYSYVHNDAGHIEAVKQSSGGKFFAVFAADIKEGETYVLSRQSAVNADSVYLYLDKIWGTGADTVGMPTFKFLSLADQSFTATYTGTLVLGLYSRTAIGNTASVTGFQLELGSVATPYEPYTGGIPSPNPDYPQPITPITGDLTITAANGDLSDTVVTPLGSVELCSLPDGTKDTYDAVAGVLTKRVGKYVGASGTSWEITDAATDASFISDKIQPGTLAGQALTALSTCTPTVYYKLATPYTIQLTPDLPVVRTGIKTLSVSANITPSFTATVKAMD